MAGSTTHMHAHTTHKLGPDSCHSNRPQVHLCSPLDNSQAFFCQTTYASDFLLPRAVWQYPLPEPVVGFDSQPLLLVALRTWSLMSLRQLTDAVTAPRYNTSHWQTHCDKNIQAHQCVHSHTVAQGLMPCWCARQQLLQVQPLFSISSSGPQQPHYFRCTRRLSWKILEFKCFSVLFCCCRCNVVSTYCNTWMLPGGISFTKFEIHHILKKSHLQSNSFVMIEKRPHP